MSRAPVTVIALGLVSLLMDVSSELVHSLLPLFLVGTLGIGAAGYGLIEGVAEAVVMVTKVVSGLWSDRLGRRKPLLLGGYGLAALVKPLFPLAGSAALVFTARVLDRLGKGLRGAPRDALIADVTPAGARGAAYGLRQAMDSAGAVLGPLLAFGLMEMLAGDLRATLWWAVPPAALAVLVLAVLVREPVRPRETQTAAWTPDWQGVRRLGRTYWGVTALGALFTLARFSEGFLLLRAADLGIPNQRVPLVLAGMSLTYALSAFPAGRLSDRLGRRALLGMGALALVAADAALALAQGVGGLALGIALWGLHLGLTQGVLAALVSDAAPADLRGGAFGLFSLASGVALLLASVLAGILWQMAGPIATFWGGAAFATATVLVLALTPAGKRPGV